MRKVVLDQIRVMFREEIRTEIERTLNPTFIQLVKDGAEDMEKIFDAVRTCDERFDALEEKVKFLSDVIEKHFQVTG